MRVHRNRHDRAFVVVPNAAARHKDLSLTARGLLVTLLSLPDGTQTTVDSVTDEVEEGRRAVSKAFSQLEAAGYLRRDRSQDPETGFWNTQSHVSDLPMDRIPAVGEPRGRNVGDSPRGVKNRGKNLLPTAPKNDGNELAEASNEEEAEKSQDKQDQAAPADAEVGRAAAVLAKLGSNDRRLALGAADILRLAPLAAEWLVDGHRELKLLTVLTTRLPERIDAPAALVQYRLKNHRPAKPEPKAAIQAPTTRASCQSCGAPFRAGVERELCQLCTDEMTQAVARLTADEPTVDPAPTEGPSPVTAEAAELLASIRQRRANGDFAPGAKSRFFAAV
ncbi:hypothetical protein ACH427_21165 [Streptomyces sp. NPDC020379]|uniref:hypothetical protein n=1 Tax=Streptomyces sp. NPDC020379 TaxID=3365071 RepID=UPI0037B0522B